MDKEQDVTELLDAIIWGRRIVEVHNSEDERKTYVFRPLTLEEKNMGNYIHKQAMRDAKDQGLLTRDELKRQAIKQELWKASYDSDLRLLREELGRQLELRDIEEKANMLDGRGRPKRSSPTGKLKRLDERIAHITTTIRKLEADYTNHIELPSSEYQAECERGNYFLRCATLSFPEMNQVWDTMDDLKGETDTKLVASLMRTYYNESIADEAAIRRVARSGFWRCKWMGSKKNRGVKTLFDREMYDLTLDQFRLVYWSQVYDSAYESMESPSDAVIEDDKLFDRWLEDQHNKREQERKKSAFDKEASKHNKTTNAHEVGFSVVGEYSEECTCGIKEQAEARGYDKRGHIHDPSCPYGVYLYYDKDKKMEKVEDIQSANPDNVRKLLGSEQKHLAAKGEDGMEEQALRGDKARTTLGMGTSYHGPGDLSKGKQGRAKPS